MCYILKVESVEYMSSEGGARTPDLPALRAGRANQPHYLSNEGTDRKNLSNFC